MIPKKKTHEEARRSHLAQQARRDALAQIREGHTVEIKLVTGDVVTIRPLSDNEDPAHKRVLILHRGRLHQDLCHDKDCELGLVTTGRRFHLKDVLGIVTHVNGVLE